MKVGSGWHGVSILTAGAPATQASHRAWVLGAHSRSLLCHLGMEGPWSITCPLTARATQLFPRAVLCQASKCDGHFLRAGPGVRAGHGVSVPTSQVVTWAQRGVGR